MILLNQKRFGNFFSGRFSLLKNLLTYLMVSSIGVLSMGVLFVSALMFSHG